MKFGKKKNNETEISSEKIINKDLGAYQELQSTNRNLIDKDDDDQLEHTKAALDEIGNAEDVASRLDDIKEKCKYKPEYVDNNIILSVNHLKQYFFFGSGPGRYKLKAVHDVNFQIKEGECFGLVGESGCGKTTTGRSIIRLYNITSGSIYYKGRRIGAGSRWNEKEIKYTKIRYNNLVKELKTKLKSGEITKDEYDSKLSEAKNHRDNVISVQKAKIAQIKADDKNAGSLTVNGEKISLTKIELKETKALISKLKKDGSDEKTIKEAEDKFNLLTAQLDELKRTNHTLMSEIQMIFQDPVDSLDPRMTVESIISEGLQIQGFKNKEENHKRVVQALEKVGLIADYANRYPHEFSGGQRQRIGIARALVMNPKLLICDEPISALDVSIRAQIINLLNDLKEEMKLSIMFIAHDLSVVKYFCDRIAVMYFGEIVELATSDELFRHPLHPYTKSLLSAIPKPNPLTEKKRKRIVYNPQECHDYSVDKPKFVEIEPGHFILANEAEIVKYKEEIAQLDKSADEGKTTSEILEETLRRSVLASQLKDEEANETNVAESNKSEECNENNENETLVSNVNEEIVSEEINETSNIENAVKDNLSEDNESTLESDAKAEPETSDLDEEVISNDESLTAEEETNDNEPTEEEPVKQRNPNHKKVYHLKKVDKKWQIILKEGKKVIKTFDTKEEGLKYGKALAKSQGGTLLVHISRGPNKGKFQKL